MNRINIIILLFVLLIYMTYKVSVKETFDVKDKEKDWLEEIFDCREIITIPTRRKYVKNFCDSFQIKPIFK